MRRLTSAAVLCGAVVAMLTGCSQIAALAPVGGDKIAEVRYGAIDVLLDHEIAILTAPVCVSAAAGPAVSCTGTTQSGEAIEVTSSTSDDAQLTIMIDGVELFSGALSDVLDEAARG